MTSEIISSSCDIDNNKDIMIVPTVSVLSSTSGITATLTNNTIQTNEKLPNTGTVKVEPGIVSSGGLKLSSTTTSAISDNTFPSYIFNPGTFTVGSGTWIESWPSWFPAPSTSTTTISPSVSTFLPLSSQELETLIKLPLRCKNRAVLVALKEAIEQALKEGKGSSEYQTPSNYQQIVVELNE